MSARFSSSRRAFLQTAGCLTASVVLSPHTAGVQAPAPTKLGLFTDSHYADRDPAGTRHYRDSINKLNDFVEKMKPEKPSFCVTLGDFYDSGATSEEELSHIRALREVYQRFPGERHFVLGNHDLTRIDKSQYLREINAPKAHYSFDKDSYHFVVLDANYKANFEPYACGNFSWTETYVPPEEQTWLKDDLEGTDKPTLVFIHQRLDADQDPHCVKNAPEVRKILERSGLVRAVLQGHDHRGGYMQINGIYYVTFRAMVEGPLPSHNAFATVTLDQNSIEVRGFHHQPSLSLPVLR